MKILIVLALIAVVSATSPRKRQKCFFLNEITPKPDIKCSKKAHEIYSACGANKVCQPSCVMPTGPRICPRNCVPGCVCEGGYVRDADYKCIKREDCPKICKKPHTTYNDCGSLCRPTCDDPTGHGGYKHCLLGMECVKGCFCEDGYVLDKNGECIREGDCPKLPQCLSSNETYTQCNANGCEPTCENPNKPQTCNPNPGCFPGCVCKEGYYRSIYASCRLFEDCPINCTKDNQEYKECGVICPQPSCKYPESVHCSDGTCKAGCFCKFGFVLDDNGECIRLEQCPYDGTCTSAHKTFQKCGSHCKSWCYIIRQRLHPKNCGEKCAPGCFCDEGYAFDDNDNCVLIKDCKCGDNEILNECSTICKEATCRSNVTEHCNEDVCYPQCNCAEGYVRDEKDNCILPKDCESSMECQKEDFATWSFKCACDDVCGKCEPDNQCTPGWGCHCNRGFLRDGRTRKCVDFDGCQPDPCLLGIDPGICEDSIKQWGYDDTEKKCREFTFKGCNGNDNRFDTEEQCITSCRKYMDLK